MSCLPKCRKKCSKKGCKKGCKKCCRCCRCCRKYNTVEVQTDAQVPSASSAQNVIVQPLLTDLYQIKMAYAYWKAGKANDRAVFDLFFRKNPFQGEFTIFAGLVECLRFLESYTFSNGDLNYLKQTLPASVENEFYEALSSLTAGDVTVYAIKEGTVVFPRVPLIRVEGPLMIAQLLETTLLNLVNFASLMTTNAVRYRILTGDGAELVEFGLRRAQGPDGGLSASKYSYVGGFNATSNVLAGKLYGIPVRGAHAHSYVLSFSGEVPSTKVTPKNGGAPGDLFPAAKNWRSKLMCLLKPTSRPHNGEFVAFVSFAVAFPEEFIALVDTYDVQSSGLINFCAVALALNDLGYQAVGVRIDNGKLSCLSNLARKYFVEISRAYGVPWFAKLKIMISNEINEELIVKLAEEGNEITAYGIGTHLVTCQKQPAMGCVYKLVELNGEPKIKLSHGQKKFTLPGKKAAYRLYNAQGQAVVDLLQPPQEAPPPANQKILCRHPYEASKCSNVIPARVENLHAVVWKGGKLAKSLPSLDAVRNEVEASLKTVREEVRSIFEPVTYKVSVSGEYYKFLQDFWAKNAPTVDI